LAHRIGFLNTAVCGAGANLR